MPLTVRELAQCCDGMADGELDRLIAGANTLGGATPNDLAFAANKKALEAIATSNAGCLLVPLEYERQNIKQSVIRAKDPRRAFALAVMALYPRKRFDGSVHPSAVIAKTATIEADSFIGPYAVIGEESEIAAGSYIGSGCSIGSQVHIGPGCVIHPNVSIYDRVRIGARALIHSGCVIGADGFGFTLTRDHYEKFPQVGMVEIGEDVEIGANCCIDRAALGVTRIGNGVKLDNLVHVGHNCSIGNHVVVAAQTGFSGSVSVDDYAVIGGQVGIGEKAHIEARAIVGGKAGILTSQEVHAGETVWGIPARPLRKHLKNLAYVNKLPELKKQLDELTQQIAALQTAQQRTKS